jgi:hypothetical protein
MYRLALEGSGCTRIAGELNRRGISTPKQNPGGWSLILVRDILRRPVYAGYACFRRECEEPQSWRDLWELGEGRHEGIVSLVDFERVQELTEARRGRSQSRDGYPFLLAGILRCANCGGPMVGSYQYRRHKRYPRYTCQNRKGRRGGCERGQTIGAERTEMLFLEALDAARKRRAPIEVTEQPDGSGELRRALEGQIESIGRRRANLLRAVEEGFSIPRATFEQRTADLDETENRLRTEIATLARTRRVPRARAFPTLTAAYLSPDIPVATRRTRLRDHIATITYQDGGFRVCKR